MRPARLLLRGAARRSLLSSRVATASYDGCHDDGSKQHSWTHSSIAAASAALALATTTTTTTTRSSATCESSDDILDSADPRGTSQLLRRNFVSWAAAKALPAVVNITVEVAQPTLFGVQRGLGAGSGFIVREDGLVVTNAHVVQNGREIAVTLNDGRRFRAKLVAMDRQSDVALVRIENGHKLPVAKIGSSSQLKPGDFVVACGSPLNLANSVTAGIVSATARHGSEIGMVSQRSEFLQVDCAINVGNSGGPLVDLDGRVVGVNTMKAQMADGISFAIPIDAAWQVVRQLLKHGRVVRPFIGFKMVAVTDAQGIWDGPPGQSRVLVAQIMPDSPAQKAGVQPNDVILAFDGQPVHSVPDILARINLDPPQRIPVTVLRPAPDPRSKPTTHHLLIVTEPEKQRLLPAPQEGTGGGAAQ